MSESNLYSFKCWKHFVGCTVLESIKLKYMQGFVSLSCSVMNTISDLNESFGAYTCILFCSELCDAHTVLFPKLGTVTGGWLLYKSSGRPAQVSVAHS